MNTITPILIALAVLLPLVALMVSLLLWVRRHRQPDAARIGVLRCLLWFLFLVLLAWAASLIFLGGAGFTSVASVLLPLSSLVLAASSIAFQIYQCQRRLRQE